MMEWSKEEKKIVMGAPSSGEAVARYFSKYPNSERNKSSIYTYYWWRKQQEEKKSVEVVKKIDISTKDYPKTSTKLVDVTKAFEKNKAPIENVVAKSVEVVKKAVIKSVIKKVEKQIKENVIHAEIVDSNFELGDSVRYTRGSALLSPIGVVVDASKRHGIPARSQKMKVRFDNYNVREVYCCDYMIVMKRNKND